ncbi:MAG: PLDc N-terminal domain-containing protein [Bacteroidia bacterium]
MLLATALSYFLNPFSSIFALIWVIILAIVLRNIWRNDLRNETNKLLWSAIVFFFPVGGVLLWWMFGD